MVSIIIPTLNEADNLPLLIPRIARTMGDRPYEILIVDDNSRDDTPGVCATLAKEHPVRLIVRPNPRHGLSGAVLEGFAQAHGNILLVMDGDLQHPPERIAALLEPLDKGEADFTLGSRYVAGGATAGRWGMGRRINSLVATLLARPFSGGVKDPMSGFFALPREVFQRARRLTPLGYKIALELMCKCRVSRPMEIPIHFDLRSRGRSKLTLAQQFRYLEHLSRLYDFQYPRASPILKFLIVLAISWLAGAIVYCFLAHVGLTRIVAAVPAYLAALLVTGLFHARYVHAQREFLPRRRPWTDFTLISSCEWIICWVAAGWIALRLPHPGAFESFLIPFGCAAVTRYILRKELLSDIRGLGVARSNEP